MQLDNVGLNLGLSLFLYPYFVNTNREDSGKSACLHNISLAFVNPQCAKYSKTCAKWQLKIDKTKILMTKDSLMKAKCIAECLFLSIGRYF